jgi:hypothetical protein
MKLKKQNADRLDLTLDYLVDMTFDSHNYKDWNDVPIEQTKKCIDQVLLC